MDYTKFHIGVYFTAFGVTSALLAVDSRPYVSALLIGAAILFILAGGAGGVIASTLPEYGSFETFSKARFGPWWFLGRGLPYSKWAALEHSLF